jgi:DNA-directed RNA polymerase specialized sigma24 family protein
LLSGRYSLLGIDDVEGFCAAIILRSQVDLAHHEHEDLLAYLVETAWELSLDFEPGGISFSTYAGTTLRRRVIDWQRQRFGGVPGAFEIVSMNGHPSRSSASTIPSTIDWDRLSPEAAWTVTHLAFPMSCGLSMLELAGQVGETTGWVTKRLKALRAELERLSV